MNQELLNQINEQKHRIKDDEIITGIVERARNKFFAKSETEIVLYDMLDYVKKQLTWKKQSAYEWLLAAMLEACERVGENFEMLFSDSDPKTHREAFDEIYW
jgi:hypothetical protein